MEGGITLALFKVINTKGETRFCYGDCQKELSIKDFPKKPARHCKKCTSKLNKERYHAMKAEREMYF